MKELASEQIRLKALNFNLKGLNWHFHILTPSCVFNKKKKVYAFILESPGESFVYYSKLKPSKLGQELAPLMHKVNVLDQTTSDEDYRPTASFRRMIDRAKQLNKEGIEWHHHVLSKTCEFNKRSANFILIFEDPEGDVIEQNSDTEPINDLKQIEPLFYSQHR